MSTSPQLDQEEIAVLKACYDYSIKEETDFVTVSEATRELEDSGLSEEEIQESLDTLLGRHLIEEYAGRKGSGEVHTIKTNVYGFVAYANQFIPEIDQIYNGTIDSIVNEGLDNNWDIATHLSQPTIIIDYIFDLLKHKGLINAAQFMKSDNADYIVTEVSTEAKKIGKKLKAEKKAEDPKETLMDPKAISQKEDKRNRVLLRVYLESNGDPFHAVEDDVIIEKESVTAEELVREIQPYLVNEGYLKYMTFRTTAIDHRGIKKVEEQLLKKDERQTAVPVKAAEVSIDLSFIADSRIRTIVERDYKELRQLDPQRTPKMVLVLSGAIIEGLLFDALVENGTWTFDEACNRPFKDMIYPAKKDGIISHDNITEVLRVFRNLVHIAREVKDKLDFNETHAEHARTSIEVIISEVRAWHQKRKVATAP